MTSPHPQRLTMTDRLRELLADDVLDALDRDDQAALDALHREHGRAFETEAAAYEQAAAVATLAMITPTMQVAPATVQARLARAALEQIDAHRRTTKPSVQSRPEALSNQRPADQARSQSASASQSVLARLGWPLAIAASIALLLVIYTSTSRSPTIAQRRASLMASSSAVINVNWTATQDSAVGPNGVQGDVVWSNERNEGYMRFTGLAVNDPTVEQYQLWIFDKNQPEATPVSGGVFDIPATAGGSEVIVPIDPAIFVKDAYLFAITREKAGGVVVSDRQRLPVLAKVE